MKKLRILNLSVSYALIITNILRAKTYKSLHILTQGEGIRQWI